jgi:hypothetical protein
MHFSVGEIWYSTVPARYISLVAVSIELLETPRFLPDRTFLHYWDPSRISIRALKTSSYSYSVYDYFIYPVDQYTSIWDVSRRI